MSRCILGRYQQQAAHDPTVFELSHAFSGKQQVGALAQVLGRMPELVHLKLRNDDLDDWALEVRFSLRKRQHLALLKAVVL